jgi:IS1 family transposase
MSAPFVYAKEAMAPKDKLASGQAGDIWTWTAIDADSKLVPSWLVGERNTAAAVRFICDLSGRMANRIQLTSDGHKPYLVGVEEGFGGQVDYAVLVKIYGQPNEKTNNRYGPQQIKGTEKYCCSGNPDPEKISTSYVERQNLTMRMSMRRFTRLTNAFSKQVENHEHAVALHFMYYNFGRIHKSLRVTPAMAAGVTDHVWSLEEIAALAK